MIHCFFINGHGLCCLKPCFIFSCLLGRICVVSPHSSLVHHCWPWFVLFHLMFHWFVITGHGLYCFTSCFTGSFVLAIVCIFLTFLMISTVSLPSLVHHHWAWFALFDYVLLWLILTVHGLYCLTSCFIGSSIEGMVCVVSRHVSLVHHYLAWFVLFNFMLHWLIITGHGFFV